MFAKLLKNHKGLVQHYGKIFQYFYQILATSEKLSGIIPAILSDFVYNNEIITRVSPANLQIFYKILNNRKGQFQLFYQILTKL